MLSIPEIVGSVANIFLVGGRGRGTDMGSVPLDRGITVLLTCQSSEFTAGPRRAISRAPDS